jgi:light-regulated signal transduction histidine kinase (bacteriophytochrome)
LYKTIRRFSGIGNDYKFLKKMNKNDELEQKVAELTTKLEMANKEVEAFTYSISHDLRAPLRAINGYTKILVEDYSEVIDDNGKKMLNSIVRNSITIGNLIDALLAFSRLDRALETVSEINMHSMVESIIANLSSEISKDIEFNIKELLPTNGQNTLIKQVWLSLISNALKFSQNMPKVKIEIGSYAKENQIVYYIKDNGVGFDMQYYHKLFGVFQSLHSQDEFAGTGISLAIVKKIITNHNGTVWAESKPNRGSCFYFSLPST